MSDILHFEEWYKVCLNTVVRRDIDPSSDQVRILNEGTTVRVVETHGNRVRIDDPIKGWISISSSIGARILTLANVTISK